MLRDTSKDNRMNLTYHWYVNYFPVDNVDNSVNNFSLRVRVKFLIIS